MIVSLKNLDEILKKFALKNGEKVKAVLKDAGLSPDESNAVEGCLSVLTALGDKVSPATLAELNSLIGMGAPAPDPVALAAKAPPPAAADATPPYPANPDDKPIMKADGTLDESAIPVNLRPVLKALWSQNKDKDVKLAAVQKELDVERDLKITREYVETAAALNFLPVKKEDLGAALKAVAIAAPKAYEQIHAVLKSVNEVAGKSGSFSEIGSSLPGASAGSEVTMAQIEQAAQVIAKDEKLTKEAAVAKFISKTADGRRMYSDYMKNQEKKAKGA